MNTVLGCAIFYLIINFDIVFGAHANYGHRKNGNPLLGEEGRKHLRSTGKKKIFFYFCWEWNLPKFIF